MSEFRNDNGPNRFDQAEIAEKIGFKIVNIFQELDEHQRSFSLDSRGSGGSTVKAQQALHDGREVRIELFTPLEENFDQDDLENDDLQSALFDITETIEDPSGGTVTRVTEGCVILTDIKMFRQGDMYRSTKYPTVDIQDYYYDHEGNRIKTPRDYGNLFEAVSKGDKNAILGESIKNIIPSLTTTYAEAERALRCFETTSLSAWEKPTEPED